MSEAQSATEQSAQSAQQEPSEVSYKELARQYNEQREQQALETSQDREEASGEDGETESDEESKTQESDTPQSAEAAPEQALSLDEMKKLVADDKIEEALAALGAAKPKRAASKHWAELRVKQTEFKREQEAERAKLAQQRKEAEELIDTASKRFRRWEQAAAAFEGGDVSEALKLAFDTDPDSLAALAIRHKLAADPQSAKLQARLDKLEREQREREEQARKEQEERQRQDLTQQQQRSLAEAMQQLGVDLRASKNETIASLAKEDDGWLRDITWSEMMRQYQETGEEITPEEAAEEALKKVTQQLRSTPASRRQLLLHQLSEQSETGTPQKPEPPVQIGSTSARPRRSGVSRRTAETGASPQKESYEALRARTARQLREALDAQVRR